jgi:hypothetical protein
MAEEISTMSILHGFVSLSMLTLLKHFYNSILR